MVVHLVPRRAGVDRVARDAEPRGALRAQVADHGIVHCVAKSKVRRSARREPRRAPGFRPNAREIRPPRGLGLDAGEARVTLDDGPPVLVPPAARQPLELDDGLDLAAGNDRERRVVAVVHGEDRVGARRRPDRVRRARLGERGLVPGAP